jgi:hypothetical protein
VYACGERFVFGTAVAVGVWRTGKKKAYQDSAEKDTVMRRLFLVLMLAASALCVADTASAQGWGYRRYRAPYYTGYRGYAPYGYGYGYYRPPVVPYYGPPAYPVYPAAPVYAAPYGYSPGVGVGIAAPGFGLQFGS